MEIGYHGCAALRRWDEMRGILNGVYSALYECKEINQGAQLTSKVSSARWRSLCVQTGHALCWILDTSKRWKVLAARLVIDKRIVAKV